MSDLVDQIARGTATLLSAEDICTRLSVSRSTFDRWVKNGSTQYIGRKPPVHSMIRSRDEDTLIEFPAPDIRIGNSPRWSIDTFKDWLLKNLTEKN